jgi:hypothetical protein
MSPHKWCNWNRINPNYPDLEKFSFTSFLNIWEVQSKFYVSANRNLEINFRVYIVYIKQNEHLIWNVNSTM